VYNKDDVRKGTAAHRLVLFYIDFEVDGQETMPQWTSHPTYPITEEYDYTLQLDAKGNVIGKIFELQCNHPRITSHPISQMAHTLIKVRLLIGLILRGIWKLQTFQVDTLTTCAKSTNPA
jgi:hypothetical protein